MAERNYESVEAVIFKNSDKPQVVGSAIGESAGVSVEFESVNELLATLYKSRWRAVLSFEHGGYTHIVFERPFDPPPNSRKL